MGYNIPIYSLIRLWNSFRLCRENRAQPWDETVVYTLKDTKWQRGAIYIGACAAIFAVLLTIFSAQKLPPHRGELTVAEFAANHNLYAKALGFDLGDEYLDENGTWVLQRQEGVTNIQRGPGRPAYQFALENGIITGVSFAVELTNYDGWLYNAYETQMLLASLALAGAQKEAGLFSNVPNRIFRQIYQNHLAGFHFSEAGVVFSCDAAYAGYWNTQSGGLLPDENAAETYFSLLFSIQKQK